MSDTERIPTYAPGDRVIAPEVRGSGSYLIVLSSEGEMVTVVDDREVGLSPEGAKAERVSREEGRDAVPPPPVLRETQSEHALAVADEQSESLTTRCYHEDTLELWEWARLHDTDVLEDFMDGETA